MKIAFLARYDFYSKFGGDTNQVEQYKKYWVLEGHDVDIITNSKFSTDYDVYIVVNIDRFLETFFFLSKLKRNDLLHKTCLLTIHHSYRDIEYFEKNYRKGMNGIIFRIFGFFGREKLKSIVFGLRERKYLWWSLRSLLINEKKILKKINKSIVFIFIAEGERKQFEIDYNITVSTYILTKNGCIIQEFERDSSGLEPIDILVSGRIEQRKNSLNIAKELSKLTNKKIVFIGGENKNNASYCDEFKKVISENSNLQYLGRVNADEVRSFYLRSVIHLSASWFEVSSLVDLEAFYYGCRVISSTNGHTKEFLKDEAVYINPKDTHLLIDKINESGTTSFDVNERKLYIEKNHSWEVNSKKLLSDIKMYFQGE